MGAKPFDSWFLGFRLFIPSFTCRLYVDNVRGLCLSSVMHSLVACSVSIMQLVCSVLPMNSSSNGLSGIWAALDTYSALVLQKVV